MATLAANRKQPDTGHWQDRHDAAVNGDYMVRRNFEQPLVKMVNNWAQYANDHKAEYGTPIGNDYVLGPEWLNIGKALRGLLNGKTGRLDCGTVDAFLLDTMHENGFTERDTD